ncbi:MAG: hypothetical protein HYV97_14710 [Bdellovibrio sp.]|nr:hypothetical protein [Bdellovibrio sp.]
MTDENFKPMRPNPQTPEKSPKSLGKKILYGLLGVLALAATKLILSFFVAETEVHMSKYDGWDAEFKASFVSSCEEASKTSILEQLNTIGKNASHENEKMSSTYANSYCECMTARVEKKNLIATKYNQLKGESAYQEETSQAVEKYMETPEGKVDTQECSKMAEVKSGVSISDEEYFAASCTTSTISQVMTEAKFDPQTIPQEKKVQLQKYAKDYCGCVSSSVYKAAKLALTKGDRHPTSNDEVSEYVNKYIDTPEGQKIMQQCGAKAESEMGK